MTVRDEAAAAFRATFRSEPAAVGAAPGRLNIIGEHTDYSLLPVLPLAIDRAVAVAAGPGPGPGVEGVSKEHGATAFPIGADPLAVSGWGRYLAAACAESPPGPWRVAVAADLPSDGGLSSSSALTVAAIASLHAAAGTAPTDLVALAVRAERRVGVEGGAMDQTVAVHARAGAALRIDFRPARIQTVPLPDELAFVAAPSGRGAPKGTEARDAYNERVVAARAAACLLAGALGVGVAPVPVLRDVSEHPQVIAALDDLPERATARVAAAAAGVDPDLVVGLTVGSFPTGRPLPVRAVARHVLEEAARVDAMVGALTATDLADVGRLIDESHRSLVAFGVSTPELDALTDAMRGAGALGSRLTGAGFGGYALAVARRGDAGPIVRAANAATGGPAIEVTATEGIG